MIKAQLMTGVIAGLSATLTYDLCRFLFAHLGQFSFDPFETFTLFGQLILGQETTHRWAFVVGTFYHLLNGITFAVSYCFLLGGRNWKLGILWAVGLELAMVVVYPIWFDVRAFLKEFIAVSAIGHLVYGAVLGFISQRYLSPFRAFSNQPSEKEAPMV